MYKVAIIDDESIIRRGLLQNMKWEELDCEIVGTAATGVEGLELMERENPDIVISDIRMPEMDGLEMVKEAKTRGFSCKFIMMSGYEEFKYAQRAITLKVEKYLSKPVNKEILGKVVRRVERQIEAEQKLARQITESLPVLRHNFIYRLLRSKIPEQEIESELNFLEIPLKDDRFVVLDIKVDDYFNRQDGSKVMEKELLKCGALNMAESLFGKDFRVVSCDLGGDAFALIVNVPEGGEEQAVKTIYHRGDELCQMAADHFQSTVTVGVGRIREGFKGLAKSYSEAQSAVGYRHIVGKNRIISIQDIHLPGRRDSINISDLEKELVASVKLGMVEETLATLEKIRCSVLEQKNVTLEKMRLVGIEIAVLMIKEAENWAQPDYENKVERFYSIANSIMGLPTLDDIFQVLEKLVHEIARGINEQRISQQKEIVDQAIAYIEENYGNEDLSLQDVAQKVHISSSYFSTIFKKEKNINFTDYLTETRMNKSKELLRNTNLKAYEIARMVGYSNPQYFSLCFKKYTGYSPLQFKNI